MPSAEKKKKKKTGRVPAKQVQGPELNPHYHQRKKKKRKGDSYILFSFICSVIALTLP
jgi:hypothetical protein